MDNKKNDTYYFSKIVDDINTIKEYLNNATYDEFVNDKKTVDAVMFRMIQLVENVKNISAEFKDEHSEIRWHKIVGFRNGIVHEYDKTDYTIVYEIIVKNLIELKNLFEQYL